ncbi:MAG: TonB-dependent receptor [Chitinophagaceae bacterium]|nr:TonB-dependent receptor [Chitinophagaceae bacterium]
MKRIALLCAMLCIMLAAVAQKNITIKIIDRTNNGPLSEANISLGGKTYATDKNGIASIPCIGAGKLTVSYTGYISYSADIKDCTDLQIELSQDAQYLDNVEISAITSRNKSLLYQPVSITKMGVTELKRGQGIFFDDAIQTNVPGVQMNRRSVSGGQQLNIRGYGNGTRGTRGVNSNFDGQGYKVYLNGIPVTDAEGITTLDDLDFGSIGNAEIIKGPAGTLYGQAIAGAINLKTITPEKGKTTIGQDILFGNYGLQRFTTHLQVGGERSSILLNYGKQKSDGFSVHNSSHKDFVNFAAEVKASEKQSFSSYLGYTDSYDQRLGELTPQQWASNDYSGNIEYIKRDGHSHVSTFRAGLAHTYAFTKTISNTTSIFGTGFRSDVSSAGGWTDKTAVNYGFRSSFDTRFNLTNSITLNGITGVEIQRQDAQVVGYNMKQNPADTTTNGWAMGKPYWVVNANTSNTAFVTTPTTIFTEWTLNLSKDLSITGGISFNKQRIVLDDRFNPATATKPSHFDTTYKDMIAPHLAINKVFSKSFSVYASYSTGYKAPVSSYFFIATPATTSPASPASARINGVLKPEQGAQFEIGSKGAAFNNRLSYQLALFHTKFTNKMTSVSVPLNSSATAYSYVINGGDQDHKGIELSVKYSIIKDGTGLFTNITPFINLAYSDFKYGDNFRYITGSTVSTLDTFNYSGLNVFGAPKLTNAIGIDAAMKCGAYISISTVHKDGFAYAMEKVSNSPKTFAVRYTEAYDLINLKLGYRRDLGKRWNIDASFGVNNLSGEKYPLMVFINQLPDAFIPAPPNAVLFGGINLKYSLNK